MSQTTTDVGRAKLAHPDLNFDTLDGGTGLHAALASMWTQVSDHLPTRWTGSVTLANTASVTVTHNFNLALTKLKLIFFEGGNQRTDTQVATDYTITQTDLNTIVIQNTSGGSKTFNALIFAYIFSGSGSTSSGLQLSVLGSNVTIKGGATLFGRKTVATYSGSGSASTDYFGDETYSLTTILGSSPANDTIYYLYIDVSTLATTPTVLSDTKQPVYSFQQSQLILSLNAPETMSGSSYIYLGWIKSATTGTAWTGSGAGFGSVDTLYSDNGAGSGSDVINYVTNPNGDTGTTGFGVTGTATVAVTSTLAELPREPLIKKAFKLASGSAADYVRYRFSIGDADKGKQLLLSWAQKTESGFVVGDWTVELYSADSGYTTFTPIALADGNIPAGDVVKELAAAMTTADNYEIRFVRGSGSKYLIIGSLFVGPRPMASIAAIHGPVAFVGSGTWSTNTTYIASYQRIGSRAKIRYEIQLAGAPDASTNLGLNMPPGLTPINVPGQDLTDFVTKYGDGFVYDASTVVPTLVGITYTAAIGFTPFYYTTAGNNADPVTLYNYLQATIPIVFASGDAIVVEWEVGVAEWQDQLETAPTTVEYAYNTDTSDADDSTSFGSGVNGVQFGSFTAQRVKKVRFQNKILPTDQILFKWTNDDGKSWLIASGASGVNNYFSLNGAAYGVGVTFTSGDYDCDVRFGDYRDSAGATTYGGAGNSWAGVVGSSTRWRIEKCSNPLGVGSSQVTATSGRYTPTVTGVSNVSSATASSFTYIRVGNFVHVSGRMAVQATAAASTFTSVKVSLPIASDLTSATDDLYGHCTALDVLQVGGGAVNPDTTNDAALMRFYSTNTSTVTWAVSFQYEVK